MHSEACGGTVRVTLQCWLSLRASPVLELLALGLLENPLECVVCCLINCYCVWPHGLCLQDSGRYFTVPAGEEELPPSHTPTPLAGLWERVEPPQISCKMYSPEPCFCVTGWHRR